MLILKQVGQFLGKNPPLLVTLQHVTHPRWGLVINNDSRTRCQLIECRGELLNRGL